MNWRKSSRSTFNGDCVEAANWRKPSRSMGNGNCAEIAAWRKSSPSYGSGACAEAGNGPGVIGVRDTKLGDASPVLKFSTDAWQAFTRRLRES